MFKALSNSHRLQIFNILTGCCEPGTACSTDEMMGCCVGDLDNQLNIASSTLSHHLKELNHAGLIDMQRRGKQIFCSINPMTLTELRSLFNDGYNLFNSAQSKNEEVSHGSKTS
jgi:ArsR family transcriptional regulator